MKNPNDTEYTQVDAKNYKTGDSVIKTELGENEKVIDGITYVLDGWYPENAGDVKFLSIRQVNYNVSFQQFQELSCGSLYNR